MKTNWNKKWLVALLITGCALQHLPSRADEQPAPPVAATAADDQNVDTNPAEPETNESSVTEPTPKSHKPRVQRQAVVVIGKDAELKENESAEAVIVIGGSAHVRGNVRQAIVTIGGDVDVDGSVGDAVVAVLGHVKAGPHAVIRGDVVAVGGTIDLAEGATIKGHTQEVELPGRLPTEHLQGLRDWLNQCVFKLRPLAPQVGWVWVVAGIFFLLYVLITIAFGRPVTACVEEMNRRPATTFLIGLLTKLLVPLLALILAVTGIGALAVPFVVAAVLLAKLVGKAALLQYLGRQIGRQSGIAFLQKPLPGLAAGAVLVTILYNIPVLGFLVFALVGVWAIGAAITAAFAGLRGEMPVPATVPAVTAPPPSTGISPAPGASAAAPPSFAPAPGPATTPASPIPPLVLPRPFPAEPPVMPQGFPVKVPEALLLPRAGFWIRMAAAFLDVILVGLLSVLFFAGPLHMLELIVPFGPARHLLKGLIDTPFPIFAVALVYFTGFWTWRGTTVGGIVLNLRVLRFDSQPVNFPVALIRALVAAFSAIVLFLGFFWIGWNREKQGWHDKVAGTIVVRHNRNMPLICL